MSSLAESGLTTLKRGIEELGGARLVLVAPKEPEREAAKNASYARGLTQRDADQIFANIPHVLDHSMFATLGQKDITADTEEVTRADLIAADSRFLDIFRMSLRRGRAFSEEENEQHARVCVIGHKLAGSLWTGDPIGHKLTVGRLQCRVIGVLSDQERFGVGFGFDWVNLLVAPSEAVFDAYPETRLEAEILAKTDAPEANDVVKRIINAILVERHHHIDDFTLYDFNSVMSKFAVIFVIMEIIVGFIAGIALLIGGVGVMNMMLVSVSERVREIGIRKALGATPADISAQFLSEALLLSGFGGLLGVVAGALAAFGASALITSLLATWVGIVSSTAAIAALLVSLGVGVIFGYFPARRAGKLDPIEAIRR
jgi:putative ABC transport system permease protein